MTKLVHQHSSSSGAADQPLPEVSEQCGDDQEGQSPQASSTPSKGSSTTPTSKQRHQASSSNRRTSTRLTSIRNDSFSSASSSSSSSSLSSAADLESGPDVKPLPSGEDCFKVPSVAPGTPCEEHQEPAGVICRLPLDRLQAILGALNILKSPADSESGTSTSPSPTYKLLCLYCDRTFASQTLMAKHTDRVHRIPKDRRSSSRVVPTINDGAFPSCSYCNKGKVLNPASEDLSQLFKHLVDQHSDRYFACEACAVRFPTDESRDAHMEATHQPPTASTPETRTRPKSKAALKSFNLNKSIINSCDIITTPLTVQVDFDTEAIKNLTIENADAVDSLSAALGMAGNSSSSTRLRSSGRTSARSGTSAPPGSDKSKVFKKSDKMLMRSSGPTLSRLGIAQHRTPRQGRRAASAKNRRKITTDSASCSSSLSGTSSSQPDNHYNKITKLKTIRSTLNNPSGTSETDFVVSRGGKNDIVSTYDEDFYETVNANVRQNLRCHLDGKLEASDPNAPSPISPVPAAIPAIRSTVVKSPHQNESKIHEATNLPAMTVFPTLLTIEQFGTDLLPLTKMKKKPITKNSWKWKWDFVKKYKYVNENGKIVKKIKQPTLGLRDLSKLDMWTQLTMRTKHEVIRNCRNLCDPGSYISAVGDSLRQEQRKQVEELNHILDSRLLPQINLEQHDQSIIKLEAVEPLEEGAEYSDQYSEQQESNTIDEDFISGLQLLRLADTNRRQQVVLSGEWARPRCYICYCCGDKFNSLKQMEEHKTFRHPYVYSTYYEIVGRELIEKQLFKHFFIPLSALTMHRIHYSRLSSYPAGFDRHRFPPIRQPSSESTATITEIKSEDSSSNEATSFSTSTASSSSLMSVSVNTASSSTSSMSSRSALDALLAAGDDFTTSFTNYPPESSPARCSKCSKECVNTLVLYAHILNCTNDYIWLQAKKRMKYRRANRRRKGCNRAALAARKAQHASAQASGGAVEKSETASNHSGGDADSSSSSSSDAKKKPKSPPRPKEKDSDIVRRLTANLPAKRISRQILQVPKQIRKRPQQIGLVKGGGKKQVVSTLAPSKAGVPRGATAMALSKLRSGKIAVMPSSIKKLPVKIKPKPKPVVKEEVTVDVESDGKKNEKIKEEKEEDTKEEHEQKEGDVGEKKEDKLKEQKASIVKKKMVVPRGRILPVRGNAFVNRTQWKGKKVLPFRKGGLSGNGRTLRSGIVKVSPTVGARKIKAKSVTPTKKEVTEKDNKEKEPSSPANVKKNSPKRKGSKSPMEVPGKEVKSDLGEVCEKRDEQKEEDTEKMEEVGSKNPEGIVEEGQGKNDEGIEEKGNPVDKEVPIESSNDAGSHIVEEEPHEPVEERSPLKEVELMKDNVMTPKASQTLSEESPNQSIVSQPITPVKSPSLNSQSASTPTTPSCGVGNQQSNKRKQKKLNDCIAMLTSKLSEKIGVDFFNQAIAKTVGPKTTAPSVETRASSKQLLLPINNLVPLHPPTITAMPLQITPPQSAPLPLVMNNRRSSVSSQPPAMLSPVSPIVTPMEEISDEPLNLSKNSPIGRSAPPRSRDVYQKPPQHLSPPPPSPTALHSPHQHPGLLRLPSPQPQHHQHQSSQQPGPSTPNRNLPSIKLPPGLIIERVEYKSRPVISKEAPSVTIVARRQPPPSMDGRSTMQSTPTEPPLPPSPQPMTRRQSIHQQQLYGDPRKITPPMHPQQQQQQQQQQQLPSPKQPQQIQPQSAPPPTPSIASTLRQERPLENRISVTITEANKDRHHSPVAKQPPITLNIPERLPVIDRAPPTSVMNPTPLIIPSVPIPVSTQSSGSGSSKRSRRKSVFVAPTPVSESPPAPVAQLAPVPPAPVVGPPFLPGPFPLFPHSLLAGPPLGLDLQRLAAVGLPPHLKPPAIPPLTVPAPPAPAAAAAAAFLEKIFLPNRDVIVKQIESAAAAAAAAAAAQSVPPVPISPSKSAPEVAPSLQLQPPKEVTPSTTPAPVEKKSRSRARSSKAKTQSVIVSSSNATPLVLPGPEVLPSQALPVEVPQPKTSVPVESLLIPAPVPIEQPQIDPPLEPAPSKKKTPPRKESTPKPTEKLDSSTIPIEPSAVDSQIDPKSQDHELEAEEPSKSSQTPTPAGNSSAKTVRKRRKNELAAILSDQLLESFKEVDQNALQDLKMMHDMSCEKPDIKFSLEQIPQLAKRKVNIRHPDLLTPATRQSPVAVGKKTPVKKVTKDQSGKDQTTDEVQEDEKPNENDETKEVEAAEKEESAQNIPTDETDKVEHRPEPVIEDISKPTSKKNAKKASEKLSKKVEDKDAKQVEVQQEKPGTPAVQPAKKAPPNRRTRKLSIDIERIAGLDRKGRQNLKAKYSKELESLDIAERLNESPVQKKTKGKASKKGEIVQTDGEVAKKEDEKIAEADKQPEKSVQPSVEEAVPASSKKKSPPKSRSKTPFPFPKEGPVEKTDLDRLKESLNIETATKKSATSKKKQLVPVQDPQNVEAELASPTPEPTTQKKSSKRKSGKADKDEAAVEPENVSNKKKKETSEESEFVQAKVESPPKSATVKTSAKRTKTPAPVEESPQKSPAKQRKTPAPMEESPPKSPAKHSKTSTVVQEQRPKSPDKQNKAPVEETLIKTPTKRSKTPAPKEEIVVKSPAKRSKTPAPAEEKPRSPSPVITPKKAKTPTPPKRIMARRSSVFVDRNLAQYLEERDAEQELLSHSSFKDDLILTSRRGTRSQGTVHLELVQSFAEAAMKPRDPRRRSAAAVAAAAASAKRAEEERKAAEEERKRMEEANRRRWEEEKRKYEEEEERKKREAEQAKPAPVLRRISARRASLFIAPPVEIEEPKVPEENIAEISKATKRQYRRRASVYQPMSFLDEEEQMEKQKQEEQKAKTQSRSKTPGPGGVWDQDIKTVGRRRNQSVFNGTPEPTIESLLEPLSLPTSGTKRRTKNSQLAENLSKLFNIEEEIQMIDRSKRKPRKSNTPVAFESPASVLVSSTPVKEAKDSPVAPKESPIVVEPKKIDELVKVVEKEVAKASIAPKPRESLSFSNDDEDDTPKLNKLVEDIINKSESESDSDDDNMSLACFVRREESFLKPNQHQSQESLEENAEDESNSAMDDDMSVTTEVTTFGGSIRKRKRRKSICVTKSRRPKPPVDDSKPVVTFNCDLCKKVFKKQDAFNKHRMTLSHIAKLSEQEYLEAQQKERNAAATTAPISERVQAQAAAHPNTGASPPKEFDKDGPMKVLSQEEKLFYECCSMLKESNADNENLNLTVSLKSDEMAPGIVCEQIPTAKASVAFPNPFSGIPEQDKASDGCFNMGDSFPSFQDVSESENYIQTINQRYADKNLADPFTKLSAADITQQAENDGNLSPQNSTKSTSSQASVFSQKTIKTKGALKGYDNFKVSIPVAGTMQTSKESKLDTLADVALCGDIPQVFDFKDSEEEKEAELSGRIPEVSTSTPQKATKGEGSPKNGLQASGKRTPAKKEPAGNKLGFRAKKKGNATPTASTSRRSTARGKKAAVTPVAKTAASNSKTDPDDVYAFQDSPPEEAETLLSYSSKKTAASTSSPATVGKSTATEAAAQSAAADQGEDSQLSSLSFSDRDDFVYGTNTLSEEDEDDKSSSYSSSQTTPKKPVKADVQKKSLIMGRIFKKTKDKPKDEVGPKKATAATADQAKPVAKDFDKLFDTLKKSEAEENPDKGGSSTEAEQSSETIDPKLLEEDDDDEKGNRNLRRRSTQKKLTETWDSDEYEDFNLKNVVDLIEKKDGRVVLKKPQKDASVTEDDKDTSKSSEDKLDESPLKIVNPPSKETAATKGKGVPEKKPVVTDETIRQVMESVIMEVTMNKNNRARDNKRRGKARPSKPASSDSSREDENLLEKDSSSENISSLDEHVLESSVMISSRTITTKFKQKLNSTQTGKQKEETKGPKQTAQQDKPPQEETKKPTTAKTVNNNNNQNQKTKVTAKAAKEQRKETPEAKSNANNAKLKQRKGPPKKMKNVAYDPDSDFEDNIKCKKVKKKLLESDIEANLKIEQLNAQLSDSILMPAPRRKRNAAETLYFWSSSSEEDDVEEDFVEVSSKGGGASNKKKKAGASKTKPSPGQQTKAQQKAQQKQKQQQSQQQQQLQQKQLDAQSAMEAGDDTSSSSEHMQQHGWIVGDSHKKLVTLLAHAKGKQDNRTVKATGGSRRK
ncbi:uncharacterized protein LOC109623312 [Aedes albopictus]|uniref:C2H2-type domain-containing protein n=1 Tax=Aedes albopictus TaxID=7160 RepID=A0ABM1XTY4_AEDAL